MEEAAREALHEAGLRGPAPRAVQPGIRTVGFAAVPPKLAHTPLRTPVHIAALAAGTPQLGYRTPLSQQVVEEAAHEVRLPTR